MSYCDFLFCPFKLKIGWEFLPCESSILDWLFIRTYLSEFIFESIPILMLKKDGSSCNIVLSGGFAIEEGFFEILLTWLILEPFELMIGLTPDWSAWTLSLCSSLSTRLYFEPRISFLEPCCEPDFLEVWLVLSYWFGKSFFSYALGDDGPILSILSWLILFVKELSSWIS